MGSIPNGNPSSQGIFIGLFLAVTKLQWKWDQGK